MAKLDQGALPQNFHNFSDENKNSLIFSVVTRSNSFYYNFSKLFFDSRGSAHQLYVLAIFTGFCSKSLILKHDIVFQKYFKKNCWFAKLICLNPVGMPSKVLTTFIIVWSPPIPFTLVKRSLLLVFNASYIGSSASHSQLPFLFCTQRWRSILTDFNYLGKLLKTILQILLLVPGGFRRNKKLSFLINTVRKLK